VGEGEGWVGEGRGWGGEHEEGGGRNMDKGRVEKICTGNREGRKWE